MKCGQNLSALLFALGLLMTPRIVLAHAKLVSSSPAANETIRIAPIEVILHFTEELEISMSTLEVKDLQTGQVVSVAPTMQVVNDKASLKVSLKPIGSKKTVFDVSWKAVSLNTHKMPGHFSFNYDPQKK